MPRRFRKRLVRERTGGPIGVPVNYVASQLLVGGGQDLVKILYTRP